MLGTVVKAGKVLDLFTVTHPEWGVCEVAERLQIPKSSAHGLLATLSDIGLMRRSAGGRYRLGWRIVELNRTLVDTTGSLAGARPVLRQLADQLGATAELGALRRHRLAVLDRAVGAAVGDDVHAIDIEAPSVHSSALGKVLLAHSGTRAVGAFIDDVALVPRTPHTVSCATRFRSELDATRLRGLGYDVEESRLGLCSVAAPIRDADGSVHTAISLTLPALPFRRNRELLSRSVQRAAARISKNARSAGTDFQAAGR
jgi:IclR family KDG regulon transcriptional repressor